MDYKAAAAQLKEALRLRTEPFGAIFFKNPDDLPPKTRQPSKVFGKKVTICQGVTLARVYGWPVGLTQDDLICIPGMLVFGFTPATDPVMELGQLFCEVGYHPDLGPALKEVEALPRFEPQEVAATFSLGARVSGEFGGKVECSEYLIAPYRSGEFRVVIPGMGDRIFSMTQDDEMVVAFPGKFLAGLLVGLKEAGKKIGARYPITFYQNFSPSFPPAYEERARKWGII